MKNRETKLAPRFDSSIERLKPSRGTAKAGFLVPDYTKLTRQPIVSRAARDLGWQLFGSPTVSVLTPTIERDIAGTQIIENHLGPCAARRAGSNQPKSFLAVVYVLGGDQWGYGPRGAHFLEAGDIGTWHSSQDVGFRVDSEVRCATFLFFDAGRPGSIAPPPAFCDYTLKRDTALGAMLSGLFGELCKQLDVMAPRYHETALAMAKEAILRALRVETAPIDATLGTTLFERIVDSIEQHFADPDLSPAELARAHGISLRYLHLLFAQRGHTVSGWIRERRLIHCSEVLASAPASLSVTDVALRSGFTDSSHFSRAFRKRFGVSPKHYRATVTET